MLGMPFFLKPGPSNEPLYKVEWKTLRTDVVGGLPQKRNRVYICAWQVCQTAPAFAWPDEFPMEPMSAVLTPSEPIQDLSQALPPNRRCKMAMIEVLKRIGAQKDPTLSTPVELDDLQDVVLFGGDQKSLKSEPNQKS